MKRLIAFILLLALPAQAADFANFGGFEFGWGGRRVTDTLAFSADFTNTAKVLTPTKGTGPATFTGGGQWVADYQGVLQFVASGNPAIPGSRIVGNTCYDTLADGTPIAGVKGILLEPQATNYFLNSSSPVTQNITVTTANSGAWTTTVWGAGTVTSSAGTATATGYGAVSAGNPRTITVTGNGSVVFTLSGADATTRVNVENSTYGTSYILTAGATATRAATVLSNPKNIPSVYPYVISGRWTANASYPAISTRTIFSTVSGGNGIQIAAHGASVVARKWVSGAIVAQSQVTMPYKAGDTMDFVARYTATGITLNVNGIEGIPYAEASAVTHGSTMYIGSTAGTSEQTVAQVNKLAVRSVSTADNPGYTTVPSSVFRFAVDNPTTQNFAGYVTVTGSPTITWTHTGANGAVLVKTGANPGTVDYAAEGPLTQPVSVTLSVSDWSDVATIRLETHYLVGSIPSLSNNTALTTLFIYSNRLTGSIPSLSSNTALISVQAQGNQLTGSVPSLSNNTALNTLNISSNQLTGSIPDLSNNTALTTLNISINQLTGWTGGIVSPLLGSFQVQNNLLPVSAVDAILAAFDAAGRNSGTRILNVGGTGNAAPSAAGLTSKANLVAKGWTVTTN